MKIVLHICHLSGMIAGGPTLHSLAFSLKVAINCVKHQSFSCKLPQLSLEPEKVMQVFEVFMLTIRKERCK